MFNWYRLFNLAEFIATELVSKEITLTLPDLSQVDIMITHGDYVSVLVDDYFLPVNLNSLNPYRFGERAVFLDVNGDVHLGVYSAA